MSRASNTPKPNQTVQIKSSAGESPASPGTPATGPGRGWVVPVVVVLLVIVAIGLIGVAKRAGTRDANQEPAPLPPVEAVAAPVTQAPPELPAAPETITNIPTATSAPAIKLQGIGYAAKRPWAVVDGKTVFVGDQVGNCRVKEISPSTITLEDANGSLQTLFLHK
jgi:hypothetical protein